VGLFSWREKHWFVSPCPGPHRDDRWSQGRKGGKEDPVVDRKDFCLDTGRKNVSCYIGTSLNPI
jgi:hypothetical protein